MNTNTARRPVSIVLAMAYALAACTDPPEDGTTDGTDAGGDTEDPTDPDSGYADTGAVACDATSREVLAPGEPVLSGLSVVGDTLVMLVSYPATAAPTHIDRVGTDGSGHQALFTSTGDRRMVSVRPGGEWVYFLERDNAAPIQVDELFRVPLAGGDVERVGDIGFEDASILAVDGDMVYLWRNTITPVGSSLERVDMGAGAATASATTVGASVDTGTAGQLHEAEDAFFFVVGGVGAAASDPLHVVSLPKIGEGATPTDLWTVAIDDPCMIPLGGLFPTPTKLACGFYGVTVRDRDGSNPTDLIAPDILAPLSLLVAIDDENLYLVDLVQNTEHTAHLRRIATDDPEITPIACDVGKVANELADGFFPIQTEYEVVVGATDVFWIEEDFDGTTLRYGIRAAAK